MHNFLHISVSFQEKVGKHSADRIHLALLQKYFLYVNIPQDMFKFWLPIKLLVTIARNFKNKRRIKRINGTLQ